MPPVVPIPAATVVPLRDGPEGLEALLLLRNARLDFVGGAWVFPGGRIDTADRIAARNDTDAARIAACREALEEAAITLLPDDLISFGHWTTPASQPKRFATWFFLADASASATIRIDGGEIVAYRWLPVTRALTEAEATTLPMVRPTIATLRQLADYDSVAAALAAASRAAAALLP